MPKYLVEMHDGRKFHVEADSQPSEAEVLTHLGQSAAPSGAPSPISAGDMLSGRVGRETNLSDSSEQQPPDWKSNLITALKPLAHPQSTSDFLSLLIPSGIGGAISAAKGYAAAGKDAVAASTRLRQIPGQMLKRLTQSAHVSPTGPEGMASVQARHAADFPTEGSGGWSPETANPEGWRAQAKMSGPPVVEQAAAPQASSSLTRIDRSELTKAGYPPELIAKIEQRAAQQQPVSFKPIRPAASAAPAPAVEAAPLSAPAPNIADVPFSQPPHPLDPSRVDIGAEKTGRAVGMTKQEVRDVATPILGRKPGEASPVLPDVPFARIVNDLRQLPPGAERDAYVARATSEFARWQAHNVVRTLRNLGLIGTVAVGGEGTRRALTSQMAGEQ